MKKLLVATAVLAWSLFVLRCASIEKSDGCISGDCQNGQGTMILPDIYGNPGGFKYVGEFKNGKYNGQGTLTWPDGSQYVGHWKDGKENGQGTITDRYGVKYVGQFRNDFYNGQGTMTWPDGRKFTGQFKDGKPIGQGTMTYPDGRKEDRIYR